jgi:hypothetical protein
LVCSPQLTEKSWPTSLRRGEGITAAVPGQTKRKERKAVVVGEERKPIRDFKKKVFILNMLINIVLKFGDTARWYGRVRKLVMQRV